MRIVMCVIIFLSPLSLRAQSISLGGGVEYNFEIEASGLNLRAYYNLGETFCFGPEFSIFLPQTYRKGNGEEVQLYEWELNVNAHYIFELSESLGFYPIIGLNITREKEEIRRNTSPQLEELIKNSWGINTGIGFHYPRGNFIPFCEFHLTSGKIDSQVLSLGAIYLFKVNEGE